MVTNKEVEAALRAWWELSPTDLLPWEFSDDVGTHFEEESFRDMRAALTAAEKVRLGQCSSSVGLTAQEIPSV